MHSNNYYNQQEFQPAYSYPSVFNPSTYYQSANYNSAQYQYPSYYNFYQMSDNSAYNFNYDYKYSSSNQLNNDSGYTSENSSPTLNSHLQATSPIKTNESDCAKNNFHSTPVTIDNAKKRKRNNTNESDETEDYETSSKRAKPLKLNIAQVKGKLKCMTCTAQFDSVAKLLIHEHKFHKNGSSNECPICCKYCLALF